MEEWKDVKGYEGIYQVSSKGRVKSLNRVDARGYKIKGKLLKPRLKKDGYVDIHLSSKDKDQSPKIHRLVAETFLPIPEELKKWYGTQYLQVNHKDENKLSNVVFNLEWCSPKYNTNYGTRNQKISESLSRKPIKMFSKNGLFIKKFISAPAACRFLRKKSASNIVDAANGRHEIAYDHRWEWA